MPVTHRPGPSAHPAAKPKQGTHLGHRPCPSPHPVSLQSSDGHRATPRCSALSPGSPQRRCGTTARATSTWSSAWRTAGMLKSSSRTSGWCSGESPCTGMVWRTGRTLRTEHGCPQPSPPKLRCFGSCKNADGVEFYNEINLYARVNSKVRLPARELLHQAQIKPSLCGLGQHRVALNPAHLPAGGEHKPGSPDPGPGTRSAALGQKQPASMVLCPPQPACSWALILRVSVVVNREESSG